MSTTGIPKRHWPKLAPPRERDRLKVLPQTPIGARRSTMQASLIAIERKLATMSPDHPDREGEVERAATIRRLLS